MRKIYIMCGLPGSGKTTWIKDNVDFRNTRIVSKDDIRQMVYGKYDFMVEDEHHIERIQNMIFKYYLQQTNLNIVVDETHITKIKREKVIKIIQDHCYSSYADIIRSHDLTKIVIVWCKENKNNLENRKNNLRGISIEKWDSVISNMKKDFEEPTIDELLNKYDEIIEFNI